MFLKSLELNGFKSFAQKTVLEFPAGITAIVGPNGAGKSNLIDAIRWLLGEREAKNLRSAKAEDLIFNGTPKKSRLSLAQAGLYFDNNSGFFPVDFKEVSIVRQVGRDGISHYFLNKSEARLKDAIDFFSRSRLGTKGLTIVNQGDSDLFVKASPEERQIMIEEILGLREYQIKKSDAERKLKNTLLNLEKVGAMIGEVAPHLRMLKRQTNKWAKRVEIRNELDELEEKYFSHKLTEIRQGEAKIKPRINFLEKEINGEREELNGLEKELKKIESPIHENSEIKGIKERENILLAEKSQIQKELGRLEAKLEILSASKNKNQFFKNEDLIGLVNEAKEILQSSLAGSDFQELKKIIKELVVKIDEFLNPAQKGDLKSKELTELNDIKENFEAKFKDLDRELKKLEEQEMKTASNLEEFGKKFQKAFELVELKRNELKKSEEERNKLIFEQEKWNFKFQELENQLGQIGKSTKELNIRPQPNESASESAKITQEELNEMEKQMFKLRTELAAIGEIDEALVKEAGEVETHYNFLKNQSKDLEKAIINLKNLIKELSAKIHLEFNNSLRLINDEFNKFFRLMFNGGQAKLKIKNFTPVLNNENSIDENFPINENSPEEEPEIRTGIEINLNLPKRKISSLETLSGGEKSLVSVAALFALISISPPPFLVLDEIDAALDENNSRRFSDFIKDFSKKTQFIVVTHNRAIMEVADVLYGITMGDDGTSKVLSLKLE